AVLAAAPHGADHAGDLLVARAAADHAPQVVAARGEEAGEHLPLGRQARAGARAAERLRDRGDDADLAGAVGVAPALRHLAEVIRLQRLDWPVAGDRLGDLAAGDDVVAAPAVRVADVHVFNEADDVAGAAEMAGHVDDAQIGR